jgi:hypothetical protein
MLDIMSSSSLEPIFPIRGVPPRSDGGGVTASSMPPRSDGVKQTRGAQRPTAYRLLAWVQFVAAVLIDLSESPVEVRP